MDIDSVCYRGFIQLNKSIRQCQAADIYCYNVTKENSGYIIWKGSIEPDHDSIDYTFHKFERNRDVAIELAVTLVFEHRRNHT